MAIKDWEFDVVKNLIGKNSGMVLDKDKVYIVESKLLAFVRLEGEVESISDLVGKIRQNDRSKLAMRLVDHMTNNETLFYRDPHFFEGLKKAIIPDLIQKRKDKKELSLWSAASSSGQEVYSLVMMLLEDFPELRSWKLTITASDISEEMLKRCREGIYSKIEVGRGLPPALQRKYFEQTPRGMQIRESIREMVNFRQVNLTEAWPNLPTMDLILVRNVLIYFDMPTKQDILRRMRRLMAPDAYLGLGGGETAITIDSEFQRVQEGRAIFYTKRDPLAPAATGS